MINLKAIFRPVARLLIGKVYSSIEQAESLNLGRLEG